MFYKKYGDGQPVILLPGLIGGEWIWDKNVDYLVENGCEVYVITPTAPEVFSQGWKDSRLKIDRIIVENDLEQVAIVGNSLGSIIAMDYVCHNSDAIGLLVISGAVARQGNSGYNQLLKPEEALQAFNEKNRAFGRSIIEQVFFDKSKIPWEREDQLYHIFDKIADPALRWLVLMQQFDVQKVIKKIECPILMLWGKEDFITPIQPWMSQLNSIQNLQGLHVFEECGHCPMIELPGEFNQLLYESLPTSIHT